MSTLDELKNNAEKTLRLYSVPLYDKVYNFLIENPEYNGVILRLIHERLCSYFKEYMEFIQIDVIDYDGYYEYDEPMVFVLVATPKDADFETIHDIFDRFFDEWWIPYVTTNYPKIIVSYA